MIPFQLPRLGLMMEPESGNPLEAEGVLNPAAARGPDGQLYLFPRLVARGNYSRIGIARGRFNEAGEPARVGRVTRASRSSPRSSTSTGLDSAAQPSSSGTLDAYAARVKAFGCVIDGHDLAAIDAAFARARRAEADGHRREDREGEGRVVPRGTRRAGTERRSIRSRRSGALAGIGDVPTRTFPTLKPDLWQRADAARAAEARMEDVQGMIVDEATALHAERNGKTFYFCSDHCQQKFCPRPLVPSPRKVWGLLWIISARCKQSKIPTCPSIIS